MKLCDVPGCGRKQYAKGWCERHWKRAWRCGDPKGQRALRDVKRRQCKAMISTAIQCGRYAVAAGYCNAHHHRYRRGRPIDGPIGIRGRLVCTVAGCGREHHSKGYCNAHLHRLIRYGNVLRNLPIGTRAMRERRTA